MAAGTQRRRGVAGGVWSGRLFPSVLAMLSLGGSSLPGALAVFQNDFSAYPSTSQSCLTSASTGSGCAGNDVTTMNACLCGNVGGATGGATGGFLSLAAKCVPDSDAALVYTTLVVNCDGTKTPLALSQAQFLAAAGVPAAGTTTPPAAGATTTVQGGTTVVVTRSAAPPTVATSTIVQTVGGKATTVTSVVSMSSASAVVITTVVGGQTVTVSQDPQTTSSSSATGSPQPAGLSDGAKYGIIGGVAAVAVALIAGVAFWCVRRRRNARAEEESHPMLPFGAAAYNPGQKWDPSAASSHHASLPPNPSPLSAHTLADQPGQGGDHRASQYYNAAAVGAGAAGQQHNRQGSLPELGVYATTAELGGDDAKPPAWRPTSMMASPGQQNLTPQQAAAGGWTSAYSTTPTPPPPSAQSTTPTPSGLSAGSTLGGAGYGYGGGTAGYDGRGWGQHQQQGAGSRTPSPSYAAELAAYAPPAAPAPAQYQQYGGSSGPVFELPPGSPAQHRPAVPQSAVEMPAPLQPAQYQGGAGGGAWTQQQQQQQQQGQYQQGQYQQGQYQQGQYQPPQQGYGGSWR